MNCSKYMIFVTKFPFVFPLKMSMAFVCSKDFTFDIERGLHIHEFSQPTSSYKVKMSKAIIPKLKTVIDLIAKAIRRTQIDLSLRYRNFFNP